MIKDIFLPEKIHAYYLFTQRIVAIEVTSDTLLTTVVRAHRRKKSIQKLIEESYNPNEPDSLTNAIKATLKRIGSYDSISIALPSSLAVFKNIEMPFTALEKIKLVLPFEVESLLPFPLQDAVVDCILNKTDLQKKTSEVFVVAMKHALLDIAISPFIAAGITPQKVTIGALELYGLLQNIESYQQKKGISFIIDFENKSTTILLLVDGKLRAIRALADGISEEFVRLHSDASAEQLQTVAQKFFSDIRFSIQAMIKNEHIQAPITSALLSGTGAHLTGVADFIGEVLECPCTVFHPHKILHNSVITLEQAGSIAPQFTTSVATALTSPITEDFNLGRLYTEPAEMQLFKKQVIVMASLCALMIISFSAYSFWTIRTLRREANNSKLQVAQELNKAFGPAIDAHQIPKSLEALIDKAQQKEENIWFAFSANNRNAFLRYLYELTSNINRDELGLNMKRLSLKTDDREDKDSLIFEGSVRDYPALIKLAEDLRATHLFAEVPEQQETKFNFQLIINKSNQGGA